jgi:hypothetical protein
MPRQVVIGFLLGLAACASSVAQPLAPHIIWARTFGGSGFEKATAVTPVSDGGFVLVHMSSSYGAGDLDRYAVRTDSNGIFLWDFTSGGSDWEETWAVWECADGGFILVGTTRSFGYGLTDGYVSKIDASGNELWWHTYGSEAADNFYDGVALPDGGYAFAGLWASYGYGSGDFYLVRTDSSGDTLWTRTYGGEYGERALAMKGTTDGGFILAGYTESGTAGGQDAYVVKTDSAGNAQWTRTVGGGRDDWAWDIACTADGGYVATGFVTSAATYDEDVFLVRFAADGSVLWSRTYGGTGTDCGYSVIQENDGGFLIAGSTESYGAGFSDAWLLKTDNEGHLLWSQTYGGGSSDEFTDIHVYSDGYIVAGATQSWGAGGWDFWLVRLSAEGSWSEPRAPELTVSPRLHPNYPNPFNASTCIGFDLPATSPARVEVVDLMGRTVSVLADGVFSPGSHNLWFDGGHLASGVYLCRLQAGDFAQTRKMMLVK